MLIRHLALVSEVGNAISPSQLCKVGAALQKQVTRDFAPIWKVRATVSAFASLDDIPLGYWPVIVVKDVKNAAGVHLDEQGQPFALVEFGSEWSLTASHETLEMLADPFGNRLVAGASPKPDQGRVEFLVEVCDPSESAEFSYTVNGVAVSDFYTPRFFDPQVAPAVRYSFTGAIERPRQVLRGGYLSWHDPVSDHWFQEQFFGAKAVFSDLGKLTDAAGSLRASLRSLVDGRTPEARAFVRSAGTDRMAQLTKSSKSNDEGASAKAKALRRQIAALKESPR